MKGLGSLIGAGLSIAGSIGGAVAGSKVAREERRRLARLNAENASWYNRRYNEDVTQRADTQRILSQTEEAIRNRNKGIAGTQAVMGGSTAAVTAERAANSSAIGNTTAAIVAGSEARKDAVENQYLQRKDTIEGLQAAANAQKAQSIATAAKGVGAAGTAIAQNLDDVDWKRKKEGVTAENPIGLDA